MHKKERNETGVGKTIGYRKCGNLPSRGIRCTDTMRRLINYMIANSSKDQYMQCMAWSKKLSIGNMIIDSEHRNLMRMVNDAIRAIETRDSLALLQELEHLDNWLLAHFANEEKIARAIDFPFALLNPAQQYSRDMLRHLRDEMETRYGMWSDGTAAHFSHFLKVWIIGHITAVDMPMKPMLQAYEYNFWPGWSNGPAPTTPGRAACGCGCGCDNYLLTAR